MTLRVMVSGAGTAGLALTHWLHLIGVDVVTFERAAEFAPVGHYISLKGNGVEMVRRMGILEACEERAVTLDELNFYTGRGRFIRRERTAALTRAIGGLIFLRRADLQSALYDLVAGRADIRFGTQIDKVDSRSDGVEVLLSDGTFERADVLVGADGIHSHTRGLLFGDGFEKPLGGYYIATTQHLPHDLRPVTHTYLGTGVMVTVYPISPDVLSLVIYTGDGAGTPPLGDNLAVRDYLLSICSDFPPTIREVLGRISTSDFVFGDIIAQVVMPSVVRGRCALVGDAAHSPTFLSGMGSSLALQDAYVLAASLARGSADLSAALASYEQTVAPIAQKYRESARGAHATLLAGGSIRSHLRNLVLGLIPNRVLEHGARRFIEAERPLAEMPPGLNNTGRLPARPGTPAEDGLSPDPPI